MPRPIVLIRLKVRAVHTRHRNHHLSILLTTNEQQNIFYSPSKMLITTTSWHIDSFTYHQYQWQFTMFSKHSLTQYNCNWHKKNFYSSENPSLSSNWSWNIFVVLLELVFGSTLKLPNNDLVEMVAFCFCFQIWKKWWKNQVLK